MKKKVVSLLAAMTLAVSALAGCGAAADSTADMAAAENTQTAAAGDTAATQEAADTTTATAGLKAGFIFLHDENSTYDLNFMNAAKEACEKLGVECVTKTNIPEGQECYEAACELADAGCDFIFADSFGHEDYVIEAAKEYLISSSAMQQVPRLIQRIWTTITMHLHLSMTDVILQVSQQV